MHCLLLPVSYAAMKQFSSAEAQHPPRVRSTLHHSFLCRPRCPSCSGGREGDSAAVAPEVGWDAALATAQGRSGQTTRIEHEGGAATCARAHPPRQPRAQAGALLEAAAWGAAEDMQRAVGADAAPLRQGGAGCKATKRQEEDSRGE